MHLSLLRKYLSHFSQNIIPRVIQLKKPKSVYSFFLPSLIISHSKYLIFKNTYYIRRKKVSGNMSSPNAKGLVAAPTYFPEKSAVVKTTFL